MAWSLDLLQGFLANTHDRYHIARTVSKLLEERGIATYERIKIAEIIRGQALINLVNALKYRPYLQMEQDF